MEQKGERTYLDVANNGEQKNAQGEQHHHHLANNGEEPTTISLEARTPSGRGSKNTQKEEEELSSRKRKGTAQLAEENKNRRKMYCWVYNIFKI